MQLLIDKGNSLLQLLVANDEPVRSQLRENQCKKSQTSSWLGCKPMFGLRSYNQAIRSR